MKKRGCYEFDKILYQKCLYEKIAWISYFVANQLQVNIQAYKKQTLNNNDIPEL
jgi:hypothetical protein